MRQWVWLTLVIALGPARRAAACEPTTEITPTAELMAADPRDVERRLVATDQDAPCCAPPPTHELCVRVYRAVDGARLVVIDARATSQVLPYELDGYAARARGANLGGRLTDTTGEVAYEDTTYRDGANHLFARALRWWDERLVPHGSIALCAGDDSEPCRAALATLRVRGGRLRTDQLRTIQGLGYQLTVPRAWTAQPVDAAPYRGLLGLRARPLIEVIRYGDAAHGIAVIRLRAAHGAGELAPIGPLQHVVSTFRTGAGKGRIVVGALRGRGPLAGIPATVAELEAAHDEDEDSAALIAICTSDAGTGCPLALRTLWFDAPARPRRGWLVAAVYGPLALVAATAVARRRRRRAAR
jgi:hypothetical protein